MHIALLLCMQITGDLNDEYLIMSMISRHGNKTLRIEANFRSARVCWRSAKLGFPPSLKAGRCKVIITTDAMTEILSET